jgi:NADPH-dependent 2,4-dienoyl-CoA reductase/sulfur reductase-like enzyme
MRHYDYLIIGGGMAADAAARGIRELDKQGTIGILSADTEPPYARPALSKRLWTDPNFNWDGALLGTEQDTDAHLDLNTRVIRILPGEDRQVVTETGETIGYGKLLLATGLTPKTLPEAERGTVIYYRGAQDYHRLMRLSLSRDSFIVIGGGYIGAELAAALIGRGREVTLVLPGEVLGDSMFPLDIAHEYQKRFIDAGVQLVPGHQVERVERVAASGSGDRGIEAQEQEGVVVTLDDGRRLTADAAVAGLGSTPAIDLAREAGLKTEDGVLVDTRLRTSDPSIWAAGDIADYPDPLLGRTRVEHVDNAKVMGRAAGRSMAGDPEPYDYTPYMYSRVLGIEWQAVGRLDPQLKTLAITLDDGGRVVVYLDDGRAAGVLLWQAPDRLDAARSLLTRSFRSEEEVAAAIR